MSLFLQNVHVWYDVHLDLTGLMYIDWLGTLAWCDEVHEDKQQNKRMKERTKNQLVNQRMNTPACVSFTTWCGCAGLSRVECMYVYALQCTVYNTLQYTVYIYICFKTQLSPQQKNKAFKVRCPKVLFDVLCVCGWWQEIKDPKPPEAEEELRKTGQVNGISHAICA